MLFGRLWHVYGPYGAKKISEKNEPRAALRGSKILLNKLLVDAPRQFPVLARVMRPGHMGSHHLHRSLVGDVTGLGIRGGLGPRTFYGEKVGMLRVKREGVCAALSGTVWAPR